jgi:hypothetical protein
VPNVRRPEGIPDLLLERERIITSLRDLIEAIDRRRPRRPGGEQDAIAREAAALRRKALRRLEELGEPRGESR